MAAFFEAKALSRTFAPQLSTGDRIAALFGGGVETRALRAVDDVSLAIPRGETLGLVGESGCGKSTLGRMLAGILAPTSGSVALEGEPVMVRGRKATTRIQTVFQDPFASLDPRMLIGDTIVEGPLAHRRITRVEARAFARTWLETVGLDGDHATRYPHQFSGGQRQRVAIARALAMEPDVLVCDEPVASLDVSIQAQIINLFLRLRGELGLTMLFISHDLGVVRHLTDRVAVMYLGRVVEIGPSAQLYRAPRHPYTHALISAVPKLRSGRSRFTVIPGEVPSPLDPPSGCAFHPRCPLSVAQCRAERPQPRPLGESTVACHRAEEMPDAMTQIARSA